MITEEKESQNFQGGEKVYPNPGTKPSTHILITLASIIGIALGVLLRMYAVELCEWLFDVALISTVNNFRNLGLGMIIAFSVIFAVYLIAIIIGYSVKEIVLSEEGIIFKRKSNPIVIQRVTDMREVRGGRVVKLTGLTAEGKTVKKRVAWSDVGRERWDEFKKDLEKVKSSD